MAGTHWFKNRSELRALQGDIVLSCSSSLTNSPLQAKASVTFEQPKKFTSLGSSPSAQHRSVAYFPLPYEDETAYSIVARFARHLGGTDSLELIRSLLKSFKKKRKFDSFANLAACLEGLPSSTLNVVSLLTNHTLLPYHLSVVTPEERNKAFAVRTQSRRQAPRGAAQWRTAVATQLRFCTDCLARMAQQHGEYYWNRVHQIPTVLVCPEHGKVLRLSCSATQLEKILPATPTICSPDATPTVSDLSDAQLHTLRSFAVRAAALARGDTSVIRSVSDPVFISALKAKGLVIGYGRCDPNKVSAALEAHFSHMRMIWPSLFPQYVGGHDGSVMGVFTSRDYISDPAAMILAAMLVDGLPTAEPPFGDGPWACPNPLVQHNSPFPVTEAELRYGPRGQICGRFKCGCGYVYAKSRHPDGRITKPKLSIFGESLRPLICRARDEGWSITRTARIVGMSDQTLRRQANIIGMVGIWIERPGRGFRSERSERPRQSRGDGGYFVRSTTKPSH